MRFAQSISAIVFMAIAAAAAASVPAPQIASPESSYSKRQADSTSCNSTNAVALPDPYDFDFGFFTYTFSRYQGQTTVVVFANVVVACQQKLMDELANLGERADAPYPYGGFYCPELTSRYAITISRAVPSTRWPMTYQVLSSVLRGLLYGVEHFGSLMPSSITLSVKINAGNVLVGFGFWGPVGANNHQAGNATITPIADSAADSVDVV